MIAAGEVSETGLTLSRARAAAQRRSGVSFLSFSTLALTVAIFALSPSARVVVTCHVASMATHLEMVRARNWNQVAVAGCYF